MNLIRKPAEIEVKTTISALLYGSPGSGKTTLALSMPAPLLIDCDGGVDRVQPNHLSDTVQVQHYEDVVDVLEANLSEYKTLVFDTGGKLLDYMTDYLIRENPKISKRDGSLTLEGFGVRKNRFISLLSRVQMMGKHTLFICHEKEERDGDDRIVRPEMGGSSAADLIKELNLVGYLQLIGNRRSVSFNPTSKFYAKNALGLPEIMYLPDVRTGNNNFMQGVVQKYAEHQAGFKQQAQDYNELLNLWSGKVAAASEADSLNSILAEVKTVTHIWDSKLLISRIFADRASGLGLVFDKASGKYQAQ